MQAGMAFAPGLRGTPPGAAVIDPRPRVRAIRATMAGRRLPPRPADEPAAALRHAPSLCASRSGILIQWAPDGTGQSQR